MPTRNGLLFASEEPDPYAVTPASLDALELHLAPALAGERTAP